jgi:hypothetical protein
MQLKKPTLKIAGIVVAAEGLGDLYNSILPRIIGPVLYFLPPPRLGISLVVARSIPQYKKYIKAKAACTRR